MARSLAAKKLNVVLPFCDGVVHHGGAGTTLSALAAGTPQLILPHYADQFVNADLVTRRGVGTKTDANTVTPAMISRLLDDSDIAAAAIEVRTEISQLPGPAEIASRVASLIELGPT